MFFRLPLMLMFDKRLTNAISIRKHFSKVFRIVSLFTYKLHAT